MTFFRGTTNNDIIIAKLGRTIFLFVQKGAIVGISLYALGFHSAIRICVNV